MECRLGEFLNGRIGRPLARREQKESFALYAYGILADGERKSVEPIAARATGSGEDGERDGAACERIKARLLNFLRDSPWDDRSVRREAARYVTVRRTPRIRSSRRIAAAVAARRSSQLGATVFAQTSGSSSSMRAIGQPA